MSTRPTLITLLACGLLAAIACGGSVNQGEVEQAVQSYLAAADASTTYTAGAFQVVDGAGRVRAVLGETEGEVALVLRDSLGAGRVAVNLTAGDQPSITLFDETGARRVGLEFALGISPAIFLRDDAGALKAGMQVQGDGGPLLFFRSSADENSFAVALVGDDQPVLSLAEPGGGHRVFLGLGDAGFEPALIFLSDEGEPIASYP